MLRCGLLGERLSHSFSPQIHAELGDYEYRLYEKKPEELEDFLRHGAFDGLNVTVPYKRAVVPFCDSLSSVAAITGSVNTLIRRPGGGLYGDSTDIFGFGFLLKKTGVDLDAGRTLVLGSGGSSLAVQAALLEMRAREFAVISRSGADHYGNLEKHSGAVMLINTTPVGMYPDNGASPIADLGLFPSCRTVIDLIYNPARTELLLQAEERGLLAVNGLTMLVAQAKRSAELFTGAPVPDEAIDAVAAKIARDTQNIALIGMPGCGKTSVGTALAKKLGRPFADTDARVAEAAGKPIPAILAEDGEDAFRKLETEALRDFCARSGMVVATGGGVVTRPENRRILRQNSVVVYVDRALNELSVSGRPLSQRDGVEALAAARLPLYATWGEVAVPVRGGVERTAADICEKLFGGMA
ncbi:MAG: shikimate kinase [Oscillospiraceae bacterium]|nr:shikimate kinase [Oscillospiraceae bacterium]